MLRKELAVFDAREAAMNEVGRRLELLDRAFVETHFRRAGQRTLLYHSCGELLRSVLDGDTLGVLLNELRDHKCKPREASRG